MKLKRKKKKGSSLLIVVAMMSILSILIISILAMTTSGYKLRTQANLRMENFYGADSGLEISEKLLHDYIKIAAEYSNKKVDADTTLVKLEDKKIAFKKTFIRFFQIGGDGTFSPTHIKAKATQEIAKEEHYEKFDRKNVEITISKLYYKNKSESSWNFTDSKIDADNTATVGISDYQKVDSLRMYFESTYDDKGTQRVIGVNFDIKIPEYGRVLTTATLAKAPKVFDFIFATDGNYNLSLNNTANMYGDLWVKGKDIKNLTPDNKYNSGITIESTLQEANVGLNGGISTNGTLTLKNAMLTTDPAKNKDICANNIKIDNTGATTKMVTNFNSSDIYVYNDFVSNGNKNEFSARNYYGLNDINNNENTPIEKIVSNEKLTRSSAMIINSEDFGKTNGSKIDIRGEAYILGTSYIDIGNGYQTGYSNAIRQLTKPYTARDDRYTYEYKDSLQIIDGKVDGTEYNLPEKIEIAKNYLLQDGDEILAKGMTVRGSEKGKSLIYNTGVVLANDVVNMPNIPMQGDIDKKKIKYATEVFNMGDSTGVTVDTFNDKTMNSDVKGSFDWDAIKKVANDDYSTKPEINKIDGNKNGFADLELQKSINDIMLQAYYDPDGKPNLAAYGFANSINGGEKPRILFNATGKKIRIKEVQTVAENSISEDDDTITYQMKTKTGASNKPSTLIISNGDVEFIPLDIYNYMMVLGVGDLDLKVASGAGAIIGNYAVASSDGIVPGYKGGQFNLTNELFKYILEESSLMGDIGNDIFATGEVKEVREAVQISSLIKKQDWKIIK